MRSIQIPSPDTRITAPMYLELRAWMLANDPDAQKMLSWSTSQIAPPGNAEIMAREIIWIILCAGRSAQAARTIERKVLLAIAERRPVVDAFGYRAKAEAIERAWRERDADYANLQEVLAKGSAEHLVAWCGSLAYIGADTKFQLAKNFGADCCKPDIWLCRLAGIADRPRRDVKFRFPACMALCRSLALAAGDNIAAIDSLLWLACNKGILQVDAGAGAVQFAPARIAARSIYAAHPD